MVEEEPEVLPENLSRAELAHQQALRFAKDLAEIFKIEKARREELQDAYQQLQAVFAGTPAGLVVLDDSYVVQRANAMFCRWVEAEPDAVHGRPIADVLATDDLVEAIKVPGGPPDQVEVSVTRPVPRVFVAHIARLASRRAPGWIVVMQDHSERRRLEYQKSEFINIAAHELRTPMSPILGYALILLEDLRGQIDEPYWSFLEGVYTGASRLQRRIDELVAFANMSRGNLWTHGASALRLAPLVEDIFYEMQDAAAEKGVSLEMHCPDPALALQVDVAPLRIVLNQLLSNGIKFNKEGGYVRVEAEQEGDATIIRVVDNGIGMPQAELEEIFQMFFQVEDHRIRHVGGLGLGLPLVQYAVSQLSGKLAVDTSLGGGTTFTLRLPTQTPEAPVASADDPMQARPETVAALSGIVEAMESRDIHSGGHARRVAHLALRIARRMDYPAEALPTLETAALLHDIGKVGIPEAILHKWGQHSAAEQTVYRRHVTLAREILEPVAGMQPVISIILAHHERWDGKGYPQGLVGAAIPPGARILSVANAYDNMTNVYTRGATAAHEEALQVICAGAGRIWDPGVVKTLAAMM
ncbi:MAG: HD domain-containing protein [Anaerolineae bacterium]|nr:HD domain-containing protein [Anaerolineae bacterium]